MSDKQGPNANPAAQGQLRAKQRDKLRQQEADLRAVMATPEGRRFVWRLVDGVAGTFGSSFAGELPLTTSYREGRRAVGIELVLETQRLCPTEYVHMLNEQLAAQKDEQLHREAVKATPPTEPDE